MVWPASSGPARRRRSPGGARPASLSPGLGSPAPRPRLHEVGASSCATAWRRASTVRMTCGSAVEGRKGVFRTSQMSFQGPTWRVGVTVFHVAPVSRSMNSKGMPMAPTAQSAMQSSQASKVRTRRYSLPTCAMRVRIRVFAAPRALLRRLYRVRLTVHHRRPTRAQLRHRCRVHVFAFSFVRCGQPCGTQRGGRGAQVTRPSRDLHIRAHG